MGSGGSSVVGILFKPLSFLSLHISPFVSDFSLYLAYIFWIAYSSLVYFQSLGLKRRSVKFLLYPDLFLKISENPGSAMSS